MKIQPFFIKVVFAVFLLLPLASGGAVYAQNSSTETAGTRRNVRMVPIAVALSSLSRSSGITVVVDRTVSSSQVPMPNSGVTPETLEEAIGEMVESLPTGTVWAKLYLPLPKSGRFDGDAVAEYALAQAKLYGNIGGTTAPGTIEVMGQKIGPERAEAVITALNLKPVYVVTNPNARNSPDPTNGQWANMSPEQRQQYAQEQATRLMNMDPQTLQQLMEQQMAIFGTMMGMMTPEQRQQMMQGMGMMRGWRGGSGAGRPNRP